MKSFTLIEVIFVIIIVGLLSIGAINAIPDNTLLNNTNFLYNKILEKKANALGFMANMDNADENRTVCLTFTKEWIKNDENYAKVKFNLSNRINISSEYNTICFDYLGRPYKTKVDLKTFDNLLHKQTEINISYQNQQKTIKILPISGYVEIE